VSKLDEAINQVWQFKNDNLKRRIAALELALQQADPARSEIICAAEDINFALLDSALTVKRAASQIDEVVHAVGILVALPYILQPGEIIENLSLAAGNTGKSVDLKTNRRIAEFKFIDWKGGSESVRQNHLFKDFYSLAEAEIDEQKSRYLYIVGAARPLKFLNSRRKLSSVMSHENKLWVEFQARYGDRFTIVREYYAYRQDRVKIVDLAEKIPSFAHEY